MWVQCGGVCGARVGVYVEACVCSCVCVLYNWSKKFKFSSKCIFSINSTFLIWSCCSNIIAKQILEFVFLKNLILILVIKTVGLIFLMFSFTRGFCFSNYMSVRCIFYINTTFSLDQQKSKNASQVDIQHKNAELHEPYQYSMNICCFSLLPSWTKIY